MCANRTQLAVDFLNVPQEPPNSSLLSPDELPGNMMTPTASQNIAGLTTTTNDGVGGSSNSAGLSARDILAHLALSDIVADTCDSSRISVSNVDPMTTNEELKALFSQFGDIKSISSAQEDKNTRIISFYDIRSAGKPCKHPVGTCILRGKVLMIQYATENESEDDDFDGSTLRVYGMPPVVSNGDMFRLFGRFGDVKDIRDGEQEDRSRRCFIVEFFDCRHARNAKDCLNNFELLGSRLTVDACRTMPLWQRRRRWQQQQLTRQVHPSHRQATHKASQSWEQTRMTEHGPDYIFTRPAQIIQSSRAADSSSAANTSSSTSNVFTPPMLDTPTDITFRDHLLQTGQQKQCAAMITPTNFSDVETNSAPILPSMNTYDFGFSPLAKQNMTPPASTFGYDGNRSAFVPVDVQAKNRASASMSNLMQIPPRGPMEMQPRPQFYSPTSFRSISGSFHSATASSGSRFHDFNSSSSSPIPPPPSASSVPRRQSSGSSFSGRSSFQPGSLAPRRGPPEARQDYYSIVIIGGRVLDTRTTLMIRNIPNKYTQRMLIEQLDRENPGCYDFLYLPIDFKNNCNVGYAFVNMVSTDFLPAFYASLHNKRWERFNSEKVCEIAYARIQGLEQLLDHFKNSSLLAEDKKVRPVILLNGRYVPFPDPDVLIRVGSNGPHKFLITDDPEYL